MRVHQTLLFHLFQLSFVFQESLVIFPFSLRTKYLGIPGNVRNEPKYGISLNCSIPSKPALNQTPLIIIAIVYWVFIVHISYLARHSMLIIEFNSNHGCVRGLLLHTSDTWSTQGLKRLTDAIHIHSAGMWLSQDSLSDSRAQPPYTLLVFTESGCLFHPLNNNWKISIFTHMYKFT